MLTTIKSLVNKGYAVTFRPGIEFDEIIVDLEKYGFRKSITFSRRYFEKHPDGDIGISYEITRAVRDFY